jgi:hypothetical protein
MKNVLRCNCKLFLWLLISCFCFTWLLKVLGSVVFFVIVLLIYYWIRMCSNQELARRFKRRKQEHMNELVTQVMFFLNSKTVSTPFSFRIFISYVVSYWFVNLRLDTLNC